MKRTQQTNKRQIAWLRQRSTLALMLCLLTTSLPVGGNAQVNFGQFAPPAANQYAPAPNQYAPTANPYSNYPPQSIPPQAYQSQPLVNPTYQPQMPFGQVPVASPPPQPVQAFQPPVTYPTQQASATSSIGSPEFLGNPTPTDRPAWPTDPLMNPSPSATNLYRPRVRDVPVDVYATEGQTGRFMLGGSVNSDLGVMGNITIEERNFDIMKFPRRPRDLFNGAFRGGGQNFRLEIVPGNQVQRYTANWTQPNLFGYSPFSLSVGGFYFQRYYRDWNEGRLGGRLALGYEVSPDLSVTTELRAEDIDIKNPRVLTVPRLNRVLGSNDLYTGRVSLIHSTRDSPFLPTEGHYLEMIYDQGFGEYDFPRGQVNFSRYFLIRERADGSGRQTLTSSHRVGFSGADTPVFENFFAGGFSTMRGFRFRGASPVEQDVQVGGRFQFLGSLEYMFPLTADDMIRAVTFVDYGTIEQDIEFDWKNFRCAPGVGLRIAVPALGPAPLAFDFAFPVLDAFGDQRQVFAFSMGLTR